MRYQKVSAVDQTVEATGLDQLWLARAQAMAERKTLEKPLAQVASGISFFDRLLFFHHTPDELEEKRIKARMADLDEAIEQGTTKIDQAWDKIGEEFPGIASARRLEAALALCLWARTEQERETARLACRAIVNEAVEALPEVPIIALDPGQALAALFPDSTSHVPALAALSALLGMSRPLVESTWEGPRPSLLYRPLLFTLVGRAMRDFKAALPETPLPIELAKRWMEAASLPTELPQLPVDLLEAYPEGSSRPPMAAMESLLLRLAGLDLCLAILREEISFLSRVAFWTDTPEEAREKQLEAERESLLEQFTTAWRDYSVGTARRRDSHWPAYASDQTLRLRDAVAAIATRDGESQWKSDCPLLNREPAMAAVQTLLDHLYRTYGLCWKRSQLLVEATTAAVPEHPPVPDHTGYVPAAQTLPCVAAMIAGRGLLSLYEDMCAAVEEADRQHGTLQRAASAVSIWDRLNLFSESQAEAEERHAGEALSLSQPRATQLALEFREAFDNGLKSVHPPLLVCLLAYELEDLLSQVRAESDSRTQSYTRNGETHTRTVHFCVLVGMPPVREALSRLVEATRPESGTILSALAALETRALLDCDEQGLLSTLLGGL